MKTKLFTTLFILPLLLGGCSKRTRNKTLSEIEITHAPDVTEYTVGDSLDISGLTVIAHFSDKSDLDVTDVCTYSPRIFEVSGPQDVTVSYTFEDVTKTTSFMVTVESAPEAVTLTSIELVSAPTKLGYVVGDSLDTTGLSVKAHFSDRSELDVTDDCICSPKVFEVSGSQNVTVSYTFNDITKTTSFAVAVNPKPVDVTLEDIELTSAPIKLEYEVGNVLDTTGMVVTAYFSDESSSDVTSSCSVSPTALNTKGIQKITVSYTFKKVTKTTEFNVTVKESTIVDTITFTVDTSTIPTGDFNSSTYPDKFKAGFSYQSVDYLSEIVCDGYAQVNSKKVTTELGEETITSLIIGSRSSEGELTFSFAKKLVSVTIGAHPQYSAYYDYKTESYVKTSQDDRNAITVNNTEWVLREGADDNRFDLVSKDFEIDSTTLVISANAAERVCIRSFTLTFEK